MTDSGLPGPPPPPAPPGWQPPPAVPQAPVRKNRTVWIVLAVAVTVLICLPALCVGSFVIVSARQQAATDKALTIAEEHYNAATSALESASESMGSFGDEGAAEDADAAADKIRTARDELAAARAAVEPLDDSQGKKDYLSSLDYATESVKGIEELVASIRVLSQLSGQITQGTAAVRSADTLLDAAIEAGNRNKYAVMRSKGASAVSRYATAATIFSSANDLEPAAGLGTVVSYIKLRRQQASLAVRMADLGKADRIAAYNKLVKTQQTLDAKAEKVGEPAIVSDPNWFEARIAAEQTAFEEAGEKADEYRAKALEDLGYGSD